MQSIGKELGCENKGLSGSESSDKQENPIKHASRDDRHIGGSRKKRNNSNISRGVRVDHYLQTSKSDQVPGTYYCFLILT